MALVLGLDCSTQSLSAMVLDTRAGRVVFEDAVNFGRELPQYHSPHGFLPGGENGEVYADPMMWLDALDMVLARLAASSVSMGDIAAVSGAGQQHGSVYLNDQFSNCLAKLDAGKTLSEQLEPCLARGVSPIWMDDSTGEECREIVEAIAGGDEEICRRTGSIATRRFTGPQIRRFSKMDPAGYGDTAHVHLVSSFMSSVLAGAPSPIDRGDGAGMNLANLADWCWDQELIQATEPALRDKMPLLSESTCVLGTISPYFAKRYGFSESCRCVIWTGDNPSSLVGMGAALPGKIVVSLGTSDTLFQSLDAPLTDPYGNGHVFGNPWGDYMALICFRSGSLAREAARDAEGLSWDDFETAAALAPQFTADMAPLLNPAFDAQESEQALEHFSKPLDALQRIKLLLEWQFLTMRVQTAWMHSIVDTVFVTGGAAVNGGLRQVIADVFAAKVCRLENTNSSCLGAALRAADAACGEGRQRLTERFCRTLDEQPDQPNPQRANAYRHDGFA